MRGNTCATPAEIKARCSRFDHGGAICGQHYSRLSFIVDGFCECCGGELELRVSGSPSSANLGIVAAKPKRFREHTLAENCPANHEWGLME